MFSNESKTCNSSAKGELIKILLLPVHGKYGKTELELLDGT